MMAKLKSAAKTVQAQNAVVGEVKAAREPRKTLSLKRNKKEEKKEKGLRENPFIMACANGRVDNVKYELKQDENYPINEKVPALRHHPPSNTAAR
jgi:hypothetical protein